MPPRIVVLIWSSAVQFSFLRLSRAYVCFLIFYQHTLVIAFPGFYIRVLYPLVHLLFYFVWEQTHVQPWVLCVFRFVSKVVSHLVGGVHIGSMVAVSVLSPLKSQIILISSEQMVLQRSRDYKTRSKGLL